MTRRTTKQGLTGLTAVVSALALLLSGCSSEEAGSAPESSASESTESGSFLPPAEGNTDYPLTVTTAVGEVDIPERPERIVMANSFDIDLFAALDVLPVGTDSQYDFYPWAVEELPGEIETTWDATQDGYPAEAIAGTDPELIVDLRETTGEAVEQVSAIAPTLGAPLGAEEEATWQERLLLLAEVLDLSDRAEAFIDEYDATFQQIRDEHPEFQDLSIDYMVAWGAEYGYSYPGSNDYEEFFTDGLGFREVPGAGRTDPAISNELIGEIEGDVLVISNQVQDQAEFEEFINSALFQQNPSVQNNRVLSLDAGGSGDWNVYYNGEETGFTGHFGRAFSVGPLANYALADLLVPLLADTLS